MDQKEGIKNVSLIEETNKVDFAFTHGNDLASVE
jgi:hypothetical protein